jgi:hypothetical protein
MDKTIAKLALLALVLTLTVAGVVRYVGGPSVRTVDAWDGEPRQEEVVVVPAPVPQIDTQNRLPDAGEVSTDAGAEAAPCVTCGRSTVNAGKQVRRYEHSRKLVWMCTEPRESMLGTMYRDCKDVVVK